METTYPARKRKLYGWEMAAIFPIFGYSLKYNRIWIHENNPWPDRVDRLGRRLKGMSSAGEGAHNAITLGNHCLFPVRLPESQPPPGDPNFYLLDWLVHELTHTWQYQHIGWIYLIKALGAQFRGKAEAYDYGGEDGLLKSRQKGILFKKFNPEQQGNIVQDYFIRKSEKKDLTAWEPYIDELKTHI